MKRLTIVLVRVEGKSAVLDVKGEGVDVEVTRTDHSDR